jgi:prepilin-type N-terminal cleavage/methylation domain-containing protein
MNSVVRGKKHRSGSFTLVEMLVVITIIGILAGIIFRLMQYAQRQSAKARTIAILERVGHALNEYNAEYGRFPPVDKVAYEYENASNQTPWLCYNYLDNPANYATRIRLFDYGLVAWLWERKRGNIRHTHLEQWVGDTERDIAAKRRWKTFIDGIDLSIRSVSNNAMWETKQDTPYSNDVATIVDGWGNEIKYVSSPPYLSYRLWSVGADGKDGTEDDIHYATWDN